MEKRISIVIPAFNGAKHIERCLDSIVNQSYKNMEIIVIDDLSTDTTIEIVERYMKEYEEIVLIKNNHNIGCGDTRNFGISIATGEYMTFIDCDDWIDSDYLLRAIESMERNKVDIVINDVRYELTNAASSTSFIEYKNNNTIDNKFALKLLCKCESQDISICSNVWNKIYRTEFIKNNNIFFPKNVLWEDNFFTFLLFIPKSKIAINPGAKYHYFKNNGSIVHTLSKKHITDMVITFSMLKDELTKNNIYEANKLNFYALFEKNLHFLLNSIKNMETDVTTAKKYLHLLFIALTDKFTISDFIEYIDYDRIVSFFEPR